MANRTIFLPAVWATGAGNVSGTPVPGVTYRNSGIAAATIEDGWPYKEINDSANFNEVMLRTTSMLLQLDQYGILPWCANTAYPVGGLAMGSDGKVYRAIAANTNYDPTTDSGTHWVKFVGRSLMADPGYVFIGDVLLQFGTFSLPYGAGSTQLVTFAIPFPVGGIMKWTGVNNGAEQQVGFGVTSTTQAYIQKGDADYPVRTGYWFILGY